jgi:hypothetical protein
MEEKFVVLNFCYLPVLFGLLSAVLSILNEPPL